VQCIDNFVDELRWEETNSEKRDKIRELKLNGEEWGRVRTFLGLLSVRLSISSTIYHILTVLQHADNAQQAFSSDNISTLHRGIPALEALYNVWDSRVDRPKYAPFSAALKAACTKINDYHKQTEKSPVYIVTMGLYPLHGVLLSPFANNYH
jgi:hypothetical protein